MEYWLSQDDEEIVSFLWEMIEDKKLNKIINVKKTVEFDEYDKRNFAVVQVIYRTGNRRKHLIELIRKLETKLNKED
jgi:F0F1-type ATP synthase delta subunit